MRFRPILSASWLGLALLLAACPSDEGGDVGGQGGLASGHYLILKDGDDLYDFEQYFVVKPGTRWEFVEYGTNAGKTVCQVTRSRGRYNLKDSAITIVVTEGGESLQKCPITQADFDGYVWEAAPSGTSQAFSIRNVTDTSFEGKDIFLGAAGWRNYRLTSDPHGYFD